MAEETDKELLELANKLDAREAKRQVKKAQTKTNKSFFTNLNYGLATLMGLPVDLPTAGLKLVGALPTDYDPVGGAVRYRDLMRKGGMALPEEGSSPEGWRARLGRLTGESLVPAGALFARGGQLANKTTTALTPFQTSLVQSFNKPGRTATGEAFAIAGATAGGEIAEKYFPDSQAAGVLGELAGSLTPAAAVGVVNALPSVKFGQAAIEGGKKLKEDFTPAGSRRRAERRAQQLAMDPEQAVEELSSESILKLDPLTQSGDVGMMSLLKAIEKQGQKQGDKFANEISDITQESMMIARKELLGKGDPTAVTNYFDNLLSHAGARSAQAISRLEPDASDVQISRRVRDEVERAYSQANNVENAMYSKLPNDASGNPNNIVETFRNILDGRSASADPDDIPAFVYQLIGDYKKPSKPSGTTPNLTTRNLEPEFKPGVSIKNPDLANLKDLRSRLSKAQQGERVKPNPNRNKIRILGELKEEVLNTLEDISPEYKDAVDYSRELNKKFTQGKIGEMLSLERRGADRVTPEGTLDFLVGGNPDEVRLGMDQLKEASPEAVQEVERGIKSMFGSVAKTDSGAFNTNAARMFLKNNKAVFESFPKLKSQIESAIKAQRLTDELSGAQIGNAVSKYAKHKSVASVFLDEDVNTAVTKLLNTTSGSGQSAKMKSMLDFVKRDESGEALDGLKSAFGQMLINGASNTKGEMLSGTKMIANLDDLMPAATKLYSGEELSRVRRIAEELRKIEKRESAKVPEGGIISDKPAKIIDIISRVGSAQVGRVVAGATGGGTVQTPGIFSGAAAEQLGRLTNDGAAQLLTRGMKDKDTLNDLLGKATPENIKAFTEKYSDIIPATSVSGVQATESLINKDNETKSAEEAAEPSLKEILNAL